MALLLILQLRQASYHCNHMSNTHIHTKDGNRRRVSFGPQLQGIQTIIRELNCKNRTQILEEQAAHFMANKDQRGSQRSYWQDKVPKMHP